MYSHALTHGSISLTHETSEQSVSRIMKTASEIWGWGWRNCSSRNYGPLVARSSVHHGSLVSPGTANFPWSFRAGYSCSTPGSLSRDPVSISISMSSSSGRTCAPQTRVVTKTRLRFPRLSKIGLCVLIILHSVSNSEEERISRW